MRVPPNGLSLPICGLALVALAAIGCSDDDNNGTGSQDPDPSISISGAHSIAIGATVALTASTQNGSDAGYAWASSNTSVATVDGLGVVTAVAAGESFISATGSTTNATGTHVVVVLPEDTETPFISITGEFSLLVGMTSQLAATTTGGTDSGYTWSSSDDTVASVDAAGLVTGLRTGTAVITAAGTDTGASAEFGMVVAVAVEEVTAWAGSGHADRNAEAFRHWDADDPAEVPTFCARCHTATGYSDYLGADGSTAFVVDTAHAPSDGIDCRACHSAAASVLSEVRFPSSAQLDGLGPEARCMTCHQGRGSTDQVNTAIASAGVGADTATTALSFINQHYYAAGATLLAGQVRGGYQYDGQVYDWRFRHVEGKETCIECHDPHSLDIKTADCVSCHGAFDDPRQIRMVTSNQDYDGDGNLTEGIDGEITTLREDKLLPAIQAYAVAQGNDPICYDAAAYPYFFIDTNANGACDAGEGIFPNRYVDWTPRLLRAAYNYQVAAKDPGAFAHNSKYTIQILFDSITDLNSVLGANQIDMTGAVRNDVAHFNGAGEASRHWDEDAEVRASCSKCHAGSEGFKFFLEFGVGTTVEEQANGLDCATCHVNTGPTYETRTAPSVLLPSDVSVDLQTDAMDASSNLCGQCHSGRSSGADVEAKIARANVPTADTPTTTPGILTFTNIHYKAAGASRAGSVGAVGLEYTGKRYRGQVISHIGGNACVTCHDPGGNAHTFSAADTFDNDGCNPCHDNTVVTDIQALRGFLRTEDYDGDGDLTEGNKGEIDTLAAQLLQDMKTYATATAGVDDICYNDSRYPYFFVDDNGNGVCDSGEGTRYTTWTPRLLRASFNYQYAHTETGAWAHNFAYVAQLLYDSIEDIGGDVSGLIRP